MNKNLKLGLGVLLLGTAIFLIYKKPKDKKEKKGQDPVCKDGEELVSIDCNCITAPCNCPKVCKPKGVLTTGGVLNEELQMGEAPQTEGFSGY